MEERRTVIERARETRRRSEGYSLLEVLVAMMILSLGAASVLSLFAAATSAHKRALDRTRAALVAERVFAEVQGRYRYGQTAEELQGLIRDEVPAELGEYRWEAYLHQPAGPSEPLEEASQTKGLVRGRTSLVIREDATEGGGEGEAEWLPGELFVRVLVRWKRSGSDRAESFFTILLPRNGEPGAAAAPATRLRGAGLIRRP